MMFQGKHIHYSPVDNKPLCSYSVKLCKQRRLKDYAFCIRHILEDKSAPFKQCAHVAKYKKQKCTNPIPANQDRHLCNSHMQVEGFIPKVPKKKPKDKNKDKDINLSGDGKVKFADRLRALLRNEDCAALSLDPPASSGGDPYAFPDPGSEKNDDVLPGTFYPSRGFWNTNSNKPVQTANDRVSTNNSKICEQSNNLFGNFHQNDNNYSNLGVGNAPPQLPKTHQLQLGTTLNNNSDSSSSSGCSNATPKSSCSSSGPSCESVQAPGGKTKPNGPKFAKTMNRLQAKIARNKVLDKLKKSQQESSTSTSQNGSKSCSNQTAALPKLTFNATNVKKEAGMIKNLPLINGNHKELLNRQLCSAQLPVCIRQIQQRTSVANVKQSKSSSKSPGSRASASKGTKREATTPTLIKASSFPTPFGSTATNREQITTNLNPPVKSRANKNVTFSSTNPNLWASASSSNGGVFFPSTAAATNQINSLARNTIQSAGTSNLTSTSALKEIKKEHPIDTINVKIEKTIPVSRKKELVAKLTQQSQKFGVKSRKKEDYIYHGFISSDSEDSDDADDCTLLKKINWCSGLECNAPTWCSTKATTRQGKQQALKSEMRRYGQLANKALSIEECVLEHQLKMARNVVQATQLYPKTTAQLLFKKYPSKIKKKLTGIGLEKNTCCYQSDKLNCSNVALPYTRHCIKHIMYNVDQLLFEHCTAKFADNTQCCVPVFDISHELPLCAEHAKKRDNYNKMASEPKAKKARKKTKASSLTRPTKRGKKKKRLSSSLIRPDSAPSSPVNDSGCKFNSNPGVPDNNSESVAFGTAIAEEATEANNLPKPIEENMESELGSELEDHFSPGTIEKSLELPLDTAELARQATKLLEEHDFTEVLNKIPDDAFSDLFNDGRNGEYIPTKEETEELERALAAVSKDVHMAKESLAKLTVTRQDIEELSSNIALPSALIAAENLTSTLDANALNDMESLNVMTGLSSSDLNSLSQAFNDGLAPSDSHHPGLSVSHLGQNSHVSASDSRATASTSSSMPVLDSDVPLHLRLSSSMLSVNSLNPHLSNGETTNECLLNQGSEYGLSSQFLENAINIYGAAAVAAGISHGVTDTGDLLVGPPDPSLLGGSLVCGQFVNHDSNLSMLGSSSLVGGGRLDGTVSEDELLSLPNLTACTPQWLLNSSMVSQNSGYQNGFLNPAAGGNNVSSLTLQQNASLSQQLLSKFPLQSLNVESVSLLANHDNLTMTGLEQYQDNLTRVTSKELRGYSRTVTSTAVNQQETKTTMLAQEGAS